jgi:hypothetical protein
MNGLEYVVEKDDREPEYGWFTINIGKVCLNCGRKKQLYNFLFLKLDMPVEQLKANMMALVDDVRGKVPAKKRDEFIWRLTVSSPPGFENFKLDLLELLGYEEMSFEEDEKVAAKQ